MALRSEALHFACRSLEIWEKFFGREHSHIAKILYNLAGRRDLVGDTKGALEFYIRSLAIFKAVHGMRSGEVADALDGIADLKWRLGESKEALICYRRYFPAQFGSSLTCLTCFAWVPEHKTR